MKTNRLPFCIKGMLPFLYGGGILLVIAFILDDYTIHPATFGVNLPQAAFFHNLGMAANLFVLPALGGMIAKEIGDSPALAAGVVGGYLALQGASGFFGAIIAGLLAGYVTLGLKRAFGPFPVKLAGMNTILIKPALGILTVGVVMHLVVTPLAAAWNTWAFNWLVQLETNHTILPGTVIGAMAGLDINGPFSKAAYMYGTAALAGSQAMVMAAVMAAGMAIPLGAGFFMLLFPQRMVFGHRHLGVASLLMGVAYLPQGAIPLAVESPLRTIPAYILSAGVAGTLSMVFRCSLHVPFGGAFVWAAIGNRLGFFTAVAVGALAGTLVLWLLRRKVTITKNF